MKHLAWGAPWVEKHVTAPPPTPEMLIWGREGTLTQGHQGFVVLLNQVVVKLLLPFVQVLPLVLGEVNSDVHKSHWNLGQQEC